MKKLNVTIVYNEDMSKILMCYRSKDPYKGLYNLVGGKLEENEDSYNAAYRELEEETGITKDDIKLTYLMDMNYYINEIELQIFVGKLNKEVELIEEVNKLSWFDSKDNFFDLTRFAGDGNIGHMIEQVKLHKNKIFKD